MAIDYNKIDKALMVATINNQLVRYLYILEIISRVVLNTEEDKLLGTKINKNIREEILPYVILLDKERKTIAKTGIKPQKTWVYTLCDSLNIELTDDDYDDEDEDDEDEDDDEDDPAYGTTCPNCEEDIFFDEDVLEEGYVICPNCGEKLDFDLDSLEDECDCGSDCCGCGEDE
jgi:hypothetical protein